MGWRRGRSVGYVAEPIPQALRELNRIIWHLRGRRRPSSRYHHDLGYFRWLFESDSSDWTCNSEELSWTSSSPLWALGNCLYGGLDFLLLDQHQGECDHGWSLIYPGPREKPHSMPNPCGCEVYEWEPDLSKKWGRRRKERREGGGPRGDLGVETHMLDTE